MKCIPNSSNPSSLIASYIPSLWTGSSVKSSQVWFTQWATRTCGKVSTITRTIFLSPLLTKELISASCQSMNICSKLVESNLDVSVDSLVQLEDHLETALSVTRARKVRWQNNVSFGTFRALIFNSLQTELMLKLIDSLKEKVSYLISSTLDILSCVESLKIFVYCISFRKCDLWAPKSTSSFFTVHLLFLGWCKCFGSESEIRFRNLVNDDHVDL